MRKLIKIILSIFSAVVLTVIVVPVMLSILLSSYTIQNYVVSKAAKAASEYLGTTVSIDKVRIKLFNRVAVDGLFIADMKGDTLLYAGNLDVGLRGYNPFTGLIRLNDVRLTDGCFFLEQDSTLTLNMRYITQKLQSKNPKKSPKDFLLRANNLYIENMHFKYRKYVVPDKPFGVNFSDLDVMRINMDIHGIGVVNDSINAVMKQMSFIEKSGFNCRRLSSDRVVVAPSGMKLNNLTIIDPMSEIHMKQLWFEYPRWRAYREFTNEVVIHSRIEKSRVSFRTIGYFAPSLRNWQSVVTATGTVDGPVSDMRGELHDAAIRDTKIDVRFRIDGLPDITQTKFTFDIADLNTNAADASFIFNDITGKSLGNATRYLDKMERIRLNGHFEGLLTDFTADGALQTTPGNVRFDVRMNPAKSGMAHIAGRVSAENFGIGHMLSSGKLGSTTLTAQVNGFLRRDSISLQTDAVVKHIAFNGYDYRDIRLNGEIRNKYYKGFVGSADPNINFALNGIFDFNGSVPRYDFNLDLNKADLHKLHINNRDTVSVLSGYLAANAVGTTLDDINGSGSIRNLTYLFDSDTLKSDEIRFLGNNNSNNKLIAVYSDFADVELRSRLNVVDIIPYMRSTLQHYLPLLEGGDSVKNRQLEAKLDSVQRTSADNYYLIKAKVKESGKFATAILPGLYVAEGTDFSFLLNPATDNFSLMLTSDLIEYKNFYLAEMNLTNRNQSDSIAVYLRAAEMGIGNFYMPGFNLIGGAKNNMVNLGVGFANSQNMTSAMINTTTRLTVNPETQAREWNLQFFPSQINVGEQRWRISSEGIIFGDSTINVRQFRILSSGQELAVNGLISKEKTDTVHVTMKNFDLSPLTGLVDRYGYRVTGRTNGHADLIAARGDRLFYSRIGFEGIHINDKPIQNSLFRSEWDNENERIRMSLVLASQDTVVTGGYQPQGGKYYLNIDIPNVDLGYLQPVLGGVMNDIDGRANTHLVLTGTGGKPLLNGTIQVPYFAGIVDFTKVRYVMNSGMIDVVNNNLILRKTKIYDDYTGSADFEMALRTNYLSNLSYDIRVTPNKLLALNTTEKDNELFYGTAYATGSVGIRGDRRGVKMDIIGTTANNSTFFMPLTDKASIAEADFIVFEDPNKKADSVRMQRYKLIQRMRQKRSPTTGKSDIDINMLLNVLPNTEVQLVIDPKIGDIIKANGTGSLNLHIRPRENIFTMYGDYEINEGNYLFTLMNVLNKRFTIERGSTIQWTGDPINALLNITATYRVRASLAPLLGGADANYRQNVPVDCNIILTDRLSQPTINFDVKVPNANAEIRSLVQNALNTQELKSQQFVWLLASNSFYVDNNMSSSFNIGTTTTAVTGIEFLSNQLSNWISSDKFSFNFGYRPKSEITSDEVEASFAGELIPNKLLIEAEANYNLGNNRGMNTRTDNQLTGDFALTYIFDRIGNLRAKAFTRTIDRFDENQGLQESGVGLYYKKDFDTFRELFMRRNRKNMVLKSSGNLPGGAMPGSSQETPEQSRTVAPSPQPDTVRNGGPKSSVK